MSYSSSKYLDYKRVRSFTDRMELGEATSRKDFIKWIEYHIHVLSYHILKMVVFDNDKSKLIDWYSEVENKWRKPISRMIISLKVRKYPLSPLAFEDRMVSLVGDTDAVKALLRVDYPNLRFDLSTLNTDEIKPRVRELAAEFIFCSYNNKPFKYEE